MLKDRNAIATIAVKDAEVARDFYENTLGLVHDGARHAGVLNYKTGNNALIVYTSTFAGTNKATAASWDVGDELETIVAALKAKGVQFEHYEFPGVTREGDIHVSAGVRAAWFKDPDQNILNLFSPVRPG